MLRRTILFAQLSMTSIILSADSADEAACKVRSMREEPTAYENAAKSPVSAQIAVTQQDSNGIYQVYTKREDAQSLKCITCAAASGFPRVDRSKPMISWHPSGDWLI